MKHQHSGYKMSGLCRLVRASISLCWNGDRIGWLPRFIKNRWESGTVKVRFQKYGEILVFFFFVVVRLADSITMHRTMYRMLLEIRFFETNLSCYVLSFSGGGIVEELLRVVYDFSCSNTKWFCDSIILFTSYKTLFFLIKLFYYFLIFELKFSKFP